MEISKVFSNVFLVLTVGFFLFVWHAITCIWHIYNNNNMLLVDNRHGPPRSLTLNSYFTFFFYFFMYTCIFIYTHIYIFIYLYNPKSSVCRWCVLSFLFFLKGPGPPLLSILSLVCSHTPFSRLVLACSLVYHKKVSNAFVWTSEREWLISINGR